MKLVTLIFLSNKIVINRIKVKRDNRFYLSVLNRIVGSAILSDDVKNYYQPLQSLIQLMTQRLRTRVHKDFYLS